MLMSQFFVPTQKEVPADAELISQQLMLRAGLIRKLGSGLYTWLPLGLRVLRKVENIVREEMNRAGALELLMPVVQPGELWKESGRIEKYGRELLKFKDRHDNIFCIGPTHEEVITDIVRNSIKSYKQLPLNLYQIQTKFRDEIRPRFGVMRAREFVMKDAYSFHLDEKSLEETYQRMHAAYTQIFTRLGLKFRAVLADSGSIGGDRSQEFHVLAPVGEDTLAYCENSDYAANLEKATCLVEGARAVPTKKMEKIHTPGLRTIDALAQNLKIPAEKSLKTLFVKGSEKPIVGFLLRGDHQLNTIKAQNLPGIAAPFAFAEENIIREIVGCSPGSLGPVGLDVPWYVDRDAALLSDFTCGANEDDYHFTNVNWDRDVALPTVADVRNVIEGDRSPDGKGNLKLTRGIEVGHIFQLGSVYSEKMNATVLDETGRSLVMQMGCYGIGVSRIVAAAIEQNHDEFGIIWPKAMAPFSVAILPMNAHKSYRVREAAEKIYADLQKAGVAVLYDDRKERPGVMFAEMDLIGIQHRIIIGDKNLDEGKVEYKMRAADEGVLVRVEDINDFLMKKV